MPRWIPPFSSSHSTSRDDAQVYIMFTVPYRSGPHRQRHSLHSNVLPRVSRIDILHVVRIGYSDAAWKLLYSADSVPNIAEFNAKGSGRNSAAPIFFVGGLLHAYSWNVHLSVQGEFSYLQSLLKVTIRKC